MRMCRETVKQQVYGLLYEKLYFTMEGISFILERHYSIIWNKWEYKLYYKDNEDSMNIYNIVEGFNQAEELFKLCLNKNVEDDEIYLYMKLNNLV